MRPAIGEVEVRLCGLHAAEVDAGAKPEIESRFSETAVDAAYRCRTCNRVSVMEVEGVPYCAEHAAKY